MPGASILGELPDSPLLGGGGGCGGGGGRKAPLDAATRALDAQFDATIEQLLSRHAHTVVRVRPGSGAAGGCGESSPGSPQSPPLGAVGGSGGGGGGGAHRPGGAGGGPLPPNKPVVTRKAIGDAATAFERSWTEGPAPEEALAAERAFATLHAKSESAEVGGGGGGGTPPTPFPVPVRQRNGR